MKWNLDHQEPRFPIPRGSFLTKKLFNSRENRVNNTWWSFEENAMKIQYWFARPFTIPSSVIVFLSSRASSNWTQPIGGVEATALLDGNRGQEGGFSKDECRSFVWIELFFSCLPFIFQERKRVKSTSPFSSRLVWGWREKISLFLILFFRLRGKAGG